MKNKDITKIGFDMRVEQKNIPNLSDRFFNPILEANIVNELLSILGIPHDAILTEYEIAEDYLTNQKVRTEWFNKIPTDDTLGAKVNYKVAYKSSFLINEAISLEGIFENHAKKFGGIKKYISHNEVFIKVFFNEHPKEIEAWLVEYWLDSKCAVRNDANRQKASDVVPFMLKDAFIEILCYLKRNEFKHCNTISAIKNHNSVKENTIDAVVQYFYQLIKELFNNNVSLTTTLIPVPKSNEGLKIEEFVQNIKNIDFNKHSFLDCCDLGGHVYSKRFARWLFDVLHIAFLAGHLRFMKSDPSDKKTAGSIQSLIDGIINSKNIYGALFPNTDFKKIKTIVETIKYKDGMSKFLASSLEMHLELGDNSEDIANKLLDKKKLL